MNFYGLMSKIFSNASVIVLIIITLIILREYFCEFVRNIRKTSNQVFLRAEKTNSPRVLLGEKFIINQRLSIGSEIEDDIFIESDEGLKIVFEIVDGEVVLNNSNNTEFIKVNGEILKDKKILKINDCVSFMDFLFKLEEG